MEKYKLGTANITRKLREQLIFCLTDSYWDFIRDKLNVPRALTLHEAYEFDIRNFKYVLETDILVKYLPGYGEKSNWELKEFIDNVPEVTRLLLNKESPLNYIELPALTHIKALINLFAQKEVTK